MAETTTPYPQETAPGSLITRDGQIQWAGLLMGPGTPYEIDRTGITGWDDLPVLDTGDIVRPDQHGAWPGARWAQPRLVGASVWLLPPAAARARDVIGAFRAATGVGGGEQWRGGRGRRDVPPRPAPPRGRLKQKPAPPTHRVRY
ncbi:phage tail protein, partial [Streptomyces sp. NPDC059409]